MCSALGVCRGGLRVLVILSVVVAAADAETRRVPAGGNLQQALDAAQPGDVVLLAAGATFTGSFVLRKKTGDGFVTVQTDDAAFRDRRQPSHGIRPDIELPVADGTDQAASFREAITVADA